MRNWQQFVFRIFFALDALGPATIVSAAPSYVATDFITQPVSVLLPDQTPAFNTTVTLRSMSRNMLRGFSGVKLESVVTDFEGRATLKYPTRIASGKGENYGFSVLPLYAIVAPAVHHAGAIVLLHPVPTGKPLTVQIAAGYTLYGRMETKDGDPISSFPITINHDLHAQSHTGAGGEIWERETVTDSEGNFTFTHVNSGTVTITPKWLRDSYWAKTVVNGQLMHNRIDRFQPEWNNTENEIVIQTSPSPAKVYQGVAVDADGKPVAGAQVTIGFSYHREEVTWGDSHTWETTNTRTDGSWRLEIPTEWVTWGDIRQASAPGPTTGTADIAATGKIKLHITTPASQTVRLLPIDSDALMPASN